jgi:flavin reductase (DIM6/NTAB) family NADH-FMN oxidoreductase RutF
MVDMPHTDRRTGEPELLDAAREQVLRDAFALFAAGVTVVSTQTRTGPYGTTVTAFSALSLRPPMVMTALNRDSQLLAHLRRSRRFGVSYLCEGQDDIAARLASSSKDCASVEWRELSGEPALAGAAVFLAARAERMQQAGDHYLITARVLDVHILDQDSAPLVYHSRAFGTLLRPAPTRV